MIFSPGSNRQVKLLFFSNSLKPPVLLFLKVVAWDRFDYATSVQYIETSPREIPESTYMYLNQQCRLSRKHVLKFSVIFHLLHNVLSWEYELGTDNSHPGHAQCVGSGIDNWLCNTPVYSSVTPDHSRLHCGIMLGEFHCKNSASEHNRIFPNKFITSRKKKFGLCIKACAYRWSVTLTDSLDWFSG